MGNNPTLFADAKDQEWIEFPTNNKGVARAQARVVYSPARTTPELEDYALGTGIKNQWRPDPYNVTFNGTNVAAVLDRITYRSTNAVVQATVAQQPLFVQSSPVFGGSCAFSDGGIGHNHTKILSATASDSLANPYWRFVVFAATRNITQACHIIGAGDGTRNAELYLDVADSFTVWKMYNGTSSSSLADYFDPTSRLAHCLIANSFDAQNPRFRGYLVRSDGKVTHLEAPTLGGGNVSNNISLLNAPFAYLVVGFPGMIADAGQGTGLLSALNGGQFVEYLSLKHGFTRPQVEVLFGGNSLTTLGTGWPKYINLPTVSARFYSAVSGWTTQRVEAGLPTAAAEYTSGVSGIKRIWAGGEIVNDIFGNVSIEDGVAHLRSLIAKIKQVGIDRVVMSNCGPVGSLPAPQEAVRQGINAALRNNWQEWGIDSPVNIGDPLPVNGQVPPASMLDPFSSDYDAGHLHHTTAGYQKRGELFRQSIEYALSR